MVDILVCAASVYEARHVSVKTPTLITGPSNAMAAAMVSTALSHVPMWERPRLIVGIGTAVSLKGAQNGEVVLPSEVACWPQVEGSEGYAELEERGYRPPGTVALAGEKGRMISAETLLTDEDAREQAAAFGYTLADVGGYGVAVAASHANIPCALVRVVSSLSDQKQSRDANAQALGTWVASLRERLR